MITLSTFGPNNNVIVIRKSTPAEAPGKVPKYDKKSLNSVRATHSCEDNTHRGFRSYVKMVCYIHKFFPHRRTYEMSQ
jgi:hypothetical protein